MDFSRTGFLLIVFLLLLPLCFAQPPERSFDADNLLLRLQLKENGSLEKSIKISSTGNSDIEIKAQVIGFDSMVSLDRDVLKLKSGSSESIGLAIKGNNRGVFIGRLLLNSGLESAEIPIIIEVQSKNVLVGLSLNSLSSEHISPDSIFTVDLSLINLAPWNSSRVNLNYEIRDFEGNTLLKENESVTVSGRASFIKDFNIPKSARLGPYAFIATAETEESFGTTTYIFNLEEKEISNFYSNLCKDNPNCRNITAILAVMLAIALLILIQQSFKRKKLNFGKMANISADKALIQKKLDSLEDAHTSGFLSNDSYKKSRKKLSDMIKNLNEK